MAAHAILTEKREEGDAVPHPYAPTTSTRQTFVDCSSTHDARSVDGETVQAQEEVNDTAPENTGPPVEDDRRSQDDSGPGKDHDIVYPSGIKKALIVLALALSVLTMALGEYCRSGTIEISNFICQTMPSSRQPFPE